MTKKTDQARVVTYIRSKLPKKMKFGEYAEQVKSKVEEIITNNKSQGKDPISFASVRIILNYYKELAFEKLKDRVPENQLRSYLDAYFRDIEREIFEKYYKR